MDPFRGGKSGGAGRARTDDYQIMSPGLTPTSRGKSSYVFGIRWGYRMGIDAQWLGIFPATLIDSSPASDALARATCYCSSARFLASHAWKSASCCSRQVSMLSLS